MHVMTPAIFGLAGTSLTADERAFFKDANPVGYILFGRNCETPAQLRALTDDLRTVSGRDDVLISIDQEGGRVARLKPPHWPTFPTGEAFARLYNTAPASAIEAVRANAAAIGLELAEMGINVDFYPCLDLRQDYGHDVIGDRAFGSDPMQVAALGRAALDGLASVEVAGCIKHMPGHGRSTADTHAELPTVRATAAELDADLAPFRTLNTAPLGMTGHIVFTAWDETHPATLSQTIVQNIIRGDIGFDGLLLTDDIDMKALSGPIAQRSAYALAAGCDVILNCWAKMDDMVAIANGVPPLSQQGHARLSRVLPKSEGAHSPAEMKARLLHKRDALLALV